MRLRTAMVVGMMVLGLHLLAGDAAAKKCGKLCGDIHKTCIADAHTFYPCKTVDKSEKKACRQGFKAAKKTCRDDYKTTLANCKASASTTTCSPSGAFVD